MGLVEFSFMMMLQKVKSVSGRACSLEHLEVFEGENALQVYSSKPTEVGEQHPDPA